MCIRDRFMSQLTPPPITLDSLLPPEMAKKAENIGVSKANLGPFRMMALAVLAGAFIALGAVFMTTVTAGASGVLLSLIHISEPTRPY